jgi:hypothetical protein
MVLRFAPLVKESDGTRSIFVGSIAAAVALEGNDSILVLKYYMQEHERRAPVPQSWNYFRDA